MTCEAPRRIPRSAGARAGHRKAPQAARLQVLDKQLAQLAGPDQHGGAAAYIAVNVASQL